jgi:hypothetical protein
MNSVQANMAIRVITATNRWVGLNSGSDVPRKYFNPVGSMLIPRMNIIVPVTSGGKNLRNLNVKEPRIPLSTPENMVIPSTRGMPPIWAAITQAANAAESEADIDWNPDPTYFVGNVCRIPVIPIENRAAERSDVDNVRSSPTVRPIEIGRAIPKETTSSICCSDEKNRGPFGGVWAAE